METSSISNQGQKLLIKILNSTDKEALESVLMELGCDIKDVLSFVNANYESEDKEALIKELTTLFNESNDEKASERTNLTRFNNSKDTGYKPKSKKNYGGSSNSLTKTDLIVGMAENAGITKAAAKKALDSMLIEIEGALQKGNRVSLVGFGSWSVSRRATREGRNPKAGQTIKIKAKNVVKFKAGSDLSNAVN